MLERGWVSLVVSVALSGCGLVFDLDPPPPEASADGGHGVDAARPDASLDASLDAAEPEDGGPIEIDAGPLVARCAEDATWREELYVAAGLIDVAARSDEVAVVYHQAVDRALVQVLDATSLAPLAQYPWDGAVDPSRLTTSNRGFALLVSYGGSVGIAEPTSGMSASVSGVVTAAGLSRYDAPAPVAAIFFGPGFASPSLLEVDFTASSVTERPVTALGAGSEVRDARMEHALARDAYVVAYAEPTGVHVAAVDRASLAIDVAPIDVLPAGAGVADAVDLSLALSGLSAAVAMQTEVDGAIVPDVAVVDSSRTVRHLWDVRGAGAGSAAAVASLSGSPIVGVARIVVGELRFEIYQWVGAVLLASFAVAAPTEGDILDVEAEPTPGSFLVARKARAGGGPATVTRIRCSLSRP